MCGSFSVAMLALLVPRLTVLRLPLELPIGSTMYSRASPTSICLISWAHSVTGACSLPKLDARVKKVREKPLSRPKPHDDLPCSKAGCTGWVQRPISQNVVIRIGCICMLVASRLQPLPKLQQLFYKRGPQALCVA